MKKYVHIKGGKWSERHHGVQSKQAAFMQAGSVRWLDALDVSDGHKMGNTGDTTIEAVLVTIK
ncbi:MAG: hypothetical protein GWN47_03305 [Woeseiaceae bacterium]|nr:hypothetical protein [Woeseiaceae bacterium]